MVTLPCEVCRSVCGDRCCPFRYASFFRFVFCGDCAAISSSRRCVVARMPSSPRSQRATVFDVTPTRAAKPDCERPILCRSRRRSLGVTGVTVYATYSSVKRGRVDRLDESRRRHRAMHAPALAVPVVGGPSQKMQERGIGRLCRAQASPRRSRAAFLEARGSISAHSTAIRAGAFAVSPARRLHARRRSQSRPLSWIRRR